jgi:antitoxin ParD1/3/4
MANSVDHGHELEAFVARLVKAGRYDSRGDVLREGVRLIHERESRLAALDASITRGLKDADAGRVIGIDEAAALLDARFGKTGTPRDAR